MFRKSDTIHKLISSRCAYEKFVPISKCEAEGGCGVLGIASNVPIKGKHLLPALSQMCNRGNGKGGGIAAAGLSPQAFGISKEVLENDYLIAIAYLDINSKAEVEQNSVYPTFEVDHIYEMPHLTCSLIPAPPKVHLYFVRVKDKIFQEFQNKHQLPSSKSVIEDEIVYQNSYNLNKMFYASMGDKKAFVLSHAKNLLILKMVGYAHDVIRYYQLENFQAHVWIGHHRYPTKGKVWHPGGAHPFIGLHEALVHNGDFANYFSIQEYLSQKNIYPLFLTDTEVAVQLFDLLHRTYEYPLEYVFETLAPTQEFDFTKLSQEKQILYEKLQKIHIHGSPDGPWFFLLAQSLMQNHKPLFRLIGITDTSMLRPQVFAIQEGVFSLGFAASEKQAIDATLKSLSEEYSHVWSRADSYWNARGGSYTDGGAFSFTVQENSLGKMELVCTDKFGNVLQNYTQKEIPQSSSPRPTQQFPDLSPQELIKWVKKQLTSWDYSHLKSFLTTLNKNVQTAEQALIVLTNLMDQCYGTKHLKRSHLLALIDTALDECVKTISLYPTSFYAFAKEPILFEPENENQTLIIDARGFRSEGEGSLAQKIKDSYKKGFKKFIVVSCCGHRFIGCGLGPSSEGVMIDVYGSSGDYLSSGIDGAKIIVHNSGQDQLAQIMKSGSLVVHGDVGQTFMYGAKGGIAFVRGNAAGRPLINAVGKTKAIINGTCLDYLAESFMAGDPLQGGGFVILNGVAFDENGQIQDLETPYPGNNLFSLSSGGAIYLRDPRGIITEAQLNGGEFSEMTQADWNIILPYLEENADHFEIPVSVLLTHKGRSLPFHQIYRKIQPLENQILQAEEAWVKKKS